MFQPFQDQWVLRGEISGLRGVLVEIIEFPFRRLFRANFLTHGLPLTLHDRKLSAVSVKLPDHWFAADKGHPWPHVAYHRPQVFAIEARGARGSRDIADEGKPVGKIGRGIVGGSRAGHSRVAHNAWHPYSALIDAPLESAKTGRRIEKFSIDTAHAEFWVSGRVGSAVVRGEDDDSPLGEPMLLESLEDCPNVLIEV